MLVMAGLRASPEDVPDIVEEDDEKPTSATTSPR